MPGYGKADSRLRRVLGAQPRQCLPQPERYAEIGRGDCQRSLERIVLILIQRETPRMGHGETGTGRSLCRRICRHHTADGLCCTQLESRQQDTAFPASGIHLFACSDAGKHTLYYRYGQVERPQATSVHHGQPARAVG